jgi:hypothetical protein
MRNTTRRVAIRVVARVREKLVVEIFMNVLWGVVLKWALSSTAINPNARKGVRQLKLKEQINDLPAEARQVRTGRTITRQSRFQTVYTL